MRCKLVGIQCGTSKKGNVYRILHFLQPFENAEAGQGEKCITEFVNESLDISGLKPGMTVDVYYSKGFDGRAYIANIQPLGK